MTFAIFHDFPGLEMVFLNSMTFHDHGAPCRGLNARPRSPGWKSPAQSRDRAFGGLLGGGGQSPQNRGLGVEPHKLNSFSNITSSHNFNFVYVGFDYMIYVPGGLLYPNTCMMKTADICLSRAVR